MATIVTKSNKSNRVLETPMPTILLAETLDELKEIQGEKLCVSQIKAQLTIGFRSFIRTKLDAVDDNEDQKNDDKSILAEVADASWKPEFRVRKTEAEKVMEILGAMSPEERKATLDKYTKDAKAKK